MASIFRRKEKTHPNDLVVEFKQTGVDAGGNPVYAEVLALEPLSIGGGGAASAVTIVDGGDVAQGTTTDVAWVSGSGTIISLLKKIASAGGSAVSIADGADVAQGTSTDASTVSSTIGLLKAIKAAIQGTLAVSGTFWQAVQPVSGTFWQATQPVSGTFWQATQPVSGPVTDTQLRASAVPVSGPLTDAALRSSAVPVSLAVNTPDVADRAARLLGHVTVDSAPSTAVTGPLTDAQLRASAPHVIVDTAPTTAVTMAAQTPDVTDRAARLLGHVTVDSAPTTAVTGPLTDAQLRASVVPVDATPAAPVAADYLPVRLTDGAAFYAASGAASPTFSGRAATFRTPGRAGTTGQKILSLHNATGSPRVVKVNSVNVDLVQTVVKAVTVLPPVIRIWKVTVLPTNGTALSKTAKDSALVTSASITALGDASADGTSSATALTATLPAGTILAEEFAPRLITAAGYEMFDRTTFFEEATITLRALEGLVVFLDYTLATQNPITDMWVVSVDWDEF